MNLVTPIELLGRLRQRSPAGFAVALHVQFATPRYLFQSYAPEWLDLYSCRGLVMRDPTVQWAFVNDGAVRWSDLAAQDPEGVLTLAATYGMHFGVTVALSDGGSKSMASFSRSDREVSDIEIAGLKADLKTLHGLTMGVVEFDPDMHKTLKQMSIYFTRT